MNHPANDLDDIVHQRTRLGILVILAEATRAQFNFLQATLELTAGNLSRHLSVLKDAGLVEIDKRYEDGRSSTRVRITRKGRRALSAELRALKAIARRVEEVSAVFETETEQHVTRSAPTGE